MHHKRSEVAEWRGECHERPWSLSWSVWRHRAWTSESGGYFNSLEVKRRTIKKDWNNCWKKRTFRQLIKRHTEQKVAENDKLDFNAELEGTRDAIHRWFGAIRNCFDYFAVCSGSEMQIKLNVYMELLNSWKVLDEGTPGSTRLDCEHYFKIANIESADHQEDNDDDLLEVKRKLLAVGKSKAVNDVKRKSLVLDTAAAQALKDDMNDDHALMRFEFLEVLLRIGLGKYGEEEPSIATALQRLMFDHVAPAMEKISAQPGPLSLPPAGVSYRDGWRKESCYSQLVDAAFKGTYMLHDAKPIHYGHLFTAAFEKLCPFKV
jgi:hypothetical protein